MKDQHGVYDLNKLRDKVEAEALAGTPTSPSAPHAPRTIEVTEHNLAVQAELCGAMVEMADDDGNRMMIPMVGFEFKVRDGGTRNPVMFDAQLASFLHGALTSFLAQLAAQRMVQDAAAGIIEQAGAGAVTEGGE